MTYIGQEKPSLDSLTHHGVKGMKWGVRRQQIKSARREVRGRKHEIGDVKAKLKESGGHNQKLETKLTKLQTDLKNDPNRAMAIRTTAGEKAALLLVGGPVGLVAIGGARLASNVRAKKLKS